MVLSYLVLWVANLQARGSVVNHQSHLQTGPHAFDRYPTIIVLRRSLCRIMAGSAVQRGYRASSEEPYAVQGPSQCCHRSMCIAYSFAAHRSNYNLIVASCPMAFDGKEIVHSLSKAKKLISATL